MKYDNLSVFQKQVVDAASVRQLAPVYLIQSKEEFDKDRALESLIEQLDGLESGELSLKRFDGDKLEGGELGQELGTIPFFSAFHVVVVTNVDKAKKGVLETLQRYVERPFEKIYLILSGSGLRSNSKLYKKIGEVGVILDVKAQRSWEAEKALPEWIMQEARRHGKNVDSQAAYELARQTGSDKTLLCRELEKLACYVGDRQRIEMADIQAICAQTGSVSIWDLGKAIFAGDATTAIAIAEALLHEGMPLQVLLRQLRSQFQTDAQVCSILSTGGTVDEVGHEFSYMKGRILQQHVQVAGRYGMSRFRRGLILIDQTELQSKNSQVSPELLLELLMVRLSV